MMNHSCMRCYVSGKVQGVWYRASAKEEAEKLGLKGWARNLPDGRVEVFVCGPTEKLELFHNWLQEGPELSLVEECLREDLAWLEYHGFDVF